MQPTPCRSGWRWDLSWSLSETEKTMNEEPENNKADASTSKAAKHGFTGSAEFYFDYGEPRTRRTRPVF